MNAPARHPPPTSTPSWPSSPTARPDARCFYDGPCVTASHTGMKLPL